MNRLARHTSMAECVGIFQSYNSNYLIEKTGFKRIISNFVQTHVMKNLLGIIVCIVYAATIGCSNNSRQSETGYQKSLTDSECDSYPNGTMYAKDYGRRYKPWIQALLDDEAEIEGGLLCSGFPTDFDELDCYISENFTRDKWLNEVLDYSIIARHVLGVYESNPIKFLTELQGMLLYKSDFCMRDAVCILIRHGKLPKSVLAKGISSLPNLFVQNDLFEWLDYINE